MLSSLVHVSAGYFDCKHCGYPKCHVGLFGEYVFRRVRIPCPKCDKDNYVRVKMTIERLPDSGAK